MTAATGPVTDIPLQIHAVIDEFGAGRWLDPSIAGPRGGLEPLGDTRNPLAGLLNSGLPWLIERVRPLARTFDLVTGDPRQVVAEIARWRDTGAGLAAVADDLATGTGQVGDQWSGPAATAYQEQTAGAEAALRGVAEGSYGLAEFTGEGGALVARVKTMISRQLADLDRDVRAALPGWLAQMPSPQVAVGPVLAALAALVARVAAVIGPLLRALVAALAAIASYARRLIDLVRAAGRWLRRWLRREPDRRDPPPEPPQPPSPPRAEPSPPRAEPSPPRAEPSPPERSWPDEEPIDYDQAWEDAEADLLRQYREAEAEQRYPRVEDAIGQVHGTPTVVEIEPTTNPELRRDGFTETWYVRDDQGTQWTVQRNPETGEFMRGHHSSGRFVK